MHDAKDLSDLASALEPVSLSLDDATPRLQPLEIADILQHAPALHPLDYNALLQYLQHTGRPYRNCQSVPHPRNSLILPPRAKRPLNIKRDEHTFSCGSSHEGNSYIQFRNPFTHNSETGAIQTIWSIPLESVMHTFIVVRQHQPLSYLEEGQGPFASFDGFLARIVDAQPSNNLVIIEPEHIITHLVTRKRPAGTYGIPRETLVLTWALNRGRH